MQSLAYLFHRHTERMIYNLHNTRDKSLLSDIVKEVNAGIVNPIHYDAGFNQVSFRLNTKLRFILANANGIFDSTKRMERCHMRDIPPAL